MFQRPIFKPHLQVETVAGEGVVLLAETYQSVLQGRLYELVTPLLDGRPVEEICQQLTGQATPAQVFYTLRKLDERGCLCEFDERLSPGEAGLWTVQGLEPSDVLRQLSEMPVALRGIGIDVAPFRSLLESIQVRVEQEGQLDVVVTDHYLRRELEVCNREALSSGRPWLLLKPVGCVIWVGPLFVPGKTGCWECLAQRMRANYPIMGYLDSIFEDRTLPAPNSGRSAATLSTAWGLGAQAVASWIIHHGDVPHLEGKIQTHDLVTWQIQSHSLLRQGPCVACHEGEEGPSRRAEPLLLQSGKKKYTEDGGHRAVSPQETLDKYGHHVSPICGAVTMLERVGGGVNGDVMHVYVSGNNIARGPRNLMSLKTDLRSSSCGKGINDLQARASALCEGIERYSGIFRGDEPRRVARLSELGESAIHPNECMLFSRRQYEQREYQASDAGYYEYIPPPFDSEQETDWSPVWSLTSQAERYLPTALCYFDYPVPRGQDSCLGCSNGNAAGNTVEEAILQGFLELVERDSVALWWYNRSRMPEVDLASFDEPYLDQLVAYLQSYDRDLWALDLTSDLGIPVTVAVSRRTVGPSEQIMFGFGAHLDPRIALLRAVTELNQMLAPLLQAGPDHPSGNLTDRATVEWLQTATVIDQPYLRPREASVRRASDYPEMWTSDLKDDVLACQKRVEERGLELLVLNQTRPEIGMPVVKVFVPGLRHFWARFAPGRLYSVPPHLGWVEQINTETQLNPIPMFL